MQPALGRLQALGNRSYAKGRGRMVAMFDREEVERQAPYGLALDLGCGTGMHAVELARRGGRSQVTRSFRRRCAPPPSTPASGLCWTEDISTA
jgi:hypothetical protein